MSMTTDPTPELLRLSFEAGREGVDWLDFTFREDVETLVSQLDDSHATGSAFKEFERGQREHKLAQLPDGRGWIVLWTTAPADYDSFGAETVTSEPGAWFGKDLRSVAVDPHHATYQADRWVSGCHFVGEEDPRVLQRQEDEKRDRWRREDAARALAEQAGAEFLRQLDDATLESEALDDGEEPPVRGRTADHAAVRKEREARSLARADAGRAKAWAEDTAAVPEGSTIVDEGTAGFRGTYGWVAGQPTRVLHGVRYSYHASLPAPNAEETNVESGGYSIRLADVASLVRLGKRYKIVDPSTVPPEAVIDRFGHENLKKIKTAEIGGAKYYAHERRFSYPIAWDVLRPDGKKVSEKTKLYKAVLTALFQVSE